MDMLPSRTIKVDKAHLAVLSPLYPRPESNSSVGKSTIAATVGCKGSVCRPPQKDIHFCKYTLYCFWVPSRHDLSMIS